MRLVRRHNSHQTCKYLRYSFRYQEICYAIGCWLHGIESEYEIKPSRRHSPSLRYLQLRSQFWWHWTLSWSSYGYQISIITTICLGFLQIVLNKPIICISATLLTSDRRTTNAQQCCSHGHLSLFGCLLVKDTDYLHLLKHLFSQYCWNGS